MNLVSRTAKTSTRTAARPWLTFTSLGLLLGAVALGTGCTHNKEGTGAAANNSGASNNAGNSNTSAAPESSTGKTVKIDSFKFQPETIEVTPGTTVTWKNNDAQDHTVWSGTSETPPDAPLKGTVKANGGTYSHTFNDPGEYPYHCDFHPSMKGKVVVK